MSGATRGRVAAVRMTRARAALLAGLALVVTLALGGCSGIPAETGVTAESAINNHLTQPAPNVEFYGPRDGASPREIVMQFLRANGTTDADYAVAREYLGPGQRTSWNAGSSVTVNTGERDWDVQQTGDEQVAVSVKETAVLDASGHLTRLATPRMLTRSFTLGKVGGQWRITKLPHDYGTWVASDDFNRAFVAQTVYYADRSTKGLVPDRQWFRGDDGLAASLAKAVLSPPPTWLNGVSLNKLPSGSGLEVDSVPVDPSSGTATVDLTYDTVKADSVTRRALWAAMLATLQQVPGVTTVTLTAGGNRLAVPGATSAPTAPQELGFALAATSAVPLIVRTTSGLRWATSDGGDSLSAHRPSTPSVKLPSPGAQWTTLAANANGTQFAGVSGDRTSLARWVNGRLTVLRTFGTDLTRPSFSREGELWVGGSTLGARPAGRESAQQTAREASAIWVIDTSLPVADAQPQAVSVPWLGTSRVISAKVASDASRIALVVQDPGGGSRLLLAGIVRDSRGNPTSLTAPLVLSAGLTDLKSVSWVDAGSVVVLARPSDGVRQPVLVALDGSPLQELTAVAGAVSVIATGQGAEEIHVLTDKGSAADRVGASWDLTSGVSDFVAPGA